MASTAISHVLETEALWLNQGRGCADGCKQCVYKLKEETSSPTMSTEALFLTCIINTIERHCLATCNVPSAFMQTDIDEQIHVHLDGELAMLLIKVDPTYQ